MPDDTAADPPDLPGWTVITLRSARQNAALRRPIMATGADFLGLPALRMRAAGAPIHARVELAAALACTQCVFTSPLAVHFADRLLPLRSYAGQALAVGSGTAAALREAGVSHVLFPVTGMHSEGLLALPALNPPADRIGLVTAPDGRSLIADMLIARGAMLRLAHVYQRGAGRLDRRHHAALLACTPPLALLLSSAQALGFVLDQLAPAAAERLRTAVVVAPSERLLDVAGRSGFRQRVLAVSPRLHDLLAALARHAKGSPFR